MDIRKIGGWILFIIASILYSSEQAYRWMYFANVASQIIWVIVCWLMITAGIAITVVSEGDVIQESVIGTGSIIIMFMVANAILLVMDSALGRWIYTGFDYFYLISNAYTLVGITDPYAIFFSYIAFPCGILLWTIISREKLQWWYNVMLYAVITMALCSIFPWLNNIYVFGVF
jgi:hypothetical protein